MRENSIFSPDFIAELKSKNDIVNIIGKYVRLEKRGRNFWACCPFHHEKTPSFCINEYEQFYHCFGCGESGDVITFLRKYENLDYLEAIKILAENAGMELPELENNEKFVKQKKLKDRCLQILNIARETYKENIYLPAAKKAQEYIKQRKLTRRELEDFELGYSLDYKQIVNKLREKKFTDEEMKASGVCEIGKSNVPYDFLSERLVFPIVNTQGDCIGFSGRDLTGESSMKYKNTYATLVFDKSKAVYGINLIKKLKQEQGVSSIILVEGQFDVITMHRYGFKNTVACMGTAVTKDHIRELKRFTDNIIICLDGDGAGQKATVRTINIFAEVPDMNVKVAILPDGKDPDEFLASNGTDAMQKLLDEAVAPMAFKIYLLKKKYNLSLLDEKTKFVKEVLAEIEKLKTNSEQEIYLAELKNLTGISIDVLRRDLNSVQNVQQTPLKTEVQPTSHELDASVKAVKFIVASLLFKKDFASFNVNIEPFITNPSLKQLYIILKQKYDSGEELLVTSVYDIFDVKDEPLIQDVINFNFNIVDNPESYFKECLWQVVESELKFRKSELSKQYNEEIDLDKKKQFLSEIAKIDIQLKNKNLGDFVND